MATSSSGRRLKSLRYPDLTRIYVNYMYLVISGQFKVRPLPSPMWRFSFRIHNQEHHRNGNFILGLMVFLIRYVMMKNMILQPFMMFPMKRLVYFLPACLSFLYNLSFSPRNHCANCRSTPFAPTSRSNQFPGKIRCECGWKMPGVNSLDPIACS